MVFGRRLDAGAANATDPSPLGAGISSTVAATIAPTPTVPIDPAAWGNYSTSRLSYDLLPQVAYSKFPVPMEVVAEVTYPNKTSAMPLSPLVLFLHGRHTTCYQGGPNGSDIWEWPCSSGWSPIPSHKGYRYVADILASQGYVVVSISANSVSTQEDDQDFGAAARSILIRYHLALWANWNSAGGDPWNDLFQGMLDLNQVVLVGHNRGGEGVNRAAIDAKASDPFKIVGIVSYGPTAFNQQVTPDIHSATILPTCDGEIYDLQGQSYIDGTRDLAISPALRSAVIALGCNHNYFNSEWTPGLAVAPAWDDWEYGSDPVCGAAVGTYRLTPQEQQRVGAAYTLALVRLAVMREDAVLPLLDGSYVRPASIGRAEVATHAVGGTAYRLLYRPENSGSPELTFGMKGGECLGHESYDGSDVKKVCQAGGDEYLKPHWLPRDDIITYPSPKALSLRWNRSGATAHFRVPKRLRNFAGLDYVDVRVANDPRQTGGSVLELHVWDAQNRSAALTPSLTSIEGWPRSSQLGRVHARALRGSLASVRSAGVNLRNIVDVLLVGKGSSGKVFVLDIATSQAKVSRPTPLNLPVLSVDQVTVQEGDGNENATLLVRGDLPMTTTGSLWVQTAEHGYKVDLVPGSTKVAAEIPFSWIGDDIYTPEYYLLSGSVTIGAMSGALTGNFRGSLTVVEDDPPPVLSVRAKLVTAREGQSLAWTFQLSAPTSGYIVGCYAVPPGRGRTELTSADVPSMWLRQSSWMNPPLQPTPLSDLSMSVPVYFGYGIMSARLLVPLASDGLKEGVEWVAFKCEDFYTGVMANLTVYGKVLP